MSDPTTWSYWTEAELETVRAHRDDMALLVTLLPNRTRKAIRNKLDSLRAGERLVPFRPAAVVTPEPQSGPWDTGHGFHAIRDRHGVSVVYIPSLS